MAAHDVLNSSATDGIGQMLWWTRDRKPFYFLQKQAVLRALIQSAVEGFRLQPSMLISCSALHWTIRLSGWHCRGRLTPTSTARSDNTGRIWSERWWHMTISHRPHRRVLYLWRGMHDFINFIFQIKFSFPNQLVTGVTNRDFPNFPGRTAYFKKFRFLRHPFLSLFGSSVIP